MAVVFAAGGTAIGGVIIGVIAEASYDDYSDYSNYGNYSNYSDAAERRRRRIEAKERDIRENVVTVNTYKINRVNEFLDDESLIREPGETVSTYQVKEDGERKIRIEEDKSLYATTRSLQNEISELEEAIRNVDAIIAHYSGAEGSALQQQKPDYISEEEADTQQQTPDYISEMESYSAEQHEKMKEVVGILRQACGLTSLHDDKK